MDKMNFTINSNVLTGEDGYLFLWQGAQKQFEFLMGKEKPTDESILNFKTNIANRKMYCAKNRIEYFHLVFPSKPNIKHNYLPSDMEIRSLYKNYYQTNDVYYPLENLLEQENAGKSTFRKLDTHMTHTGSLVVMQTVFESYFKNFYLSGSYFSEIIKEVSGDLAIMTASSETTKEVFLEAKDWRGEPFASKQVDNFNELKGNGGSISFNYTPNALHNKKILIFGDSFFLGALSLIRPLFKQIFYIRSDVFKPEFVHLFNADIVVTANTERYLSKVNNDNSAKFLFFEDYYKDYYREKPSEAFHEALESIMFERVDSLKTKRYLNNLKASIYNNLFKQSLKKKNFAYSTYALKRLLKFKPENKSFIDRLDSLKKMKLELTLASLSLQEIQRFATFIFKLNMRKQFISHEKIFELNRLNLFGENYIPVLIENIVQLLKIEKQNEDECKVTFVQVVLLSEAIQTEKGLIVLIENYTQKDLNRLYTLFKASYCFIASELLFSAMYDRYLSEKNQNIEGWFCNYKKYFTDKNSEKCNLSFDDSFLASKLDKEFAEFIKDKSVAIVGPAPTENDYGYEIDQFDIVVRLSFVSNEKSIPDPHRIGSKTNVSYFSAHLRFFEEDIPNIVKAVQFVCVSLPKFTPSVLDYNNVRQSHILDVCYTGKPNLIQSAVLELLACKPSRMKVFASNLFVSENAYSSAYPSTDMLNKVASNQPHRGLNSIMFTNHDPINNFLILKILYENQYIECDKELSAVLNFSVKEYIQALEIIYG